MFEIGSTLREERRRRGLRLEDVEKGTHLSARFLDAIEREDFDRLPSGVYRRSFVRGYADFLGLDGDAYAREYEHRFAPPEPEPEPVRPRARIRIAPALAVVAASVVVLIADRRLVAHKFGQNEDHRAADDDDRRGRHLDDAPRASPTPRRHRRRTTTASLRITAARGSCWLSVRVASSSGTTVYEQTLQHGGERPLRPGPEAVGAHRRAVERRREHRRARVSLPSQTGDVVATAAGLA